MKFVKHKDSIVNITIFNNQQDEKKLLSYLKKIYEIGKDYEMIYSYFEPRGNEGRSFEQEMNLFLEKKKIDRSYQPKFSYPEIENLDIIKLKEAIAQLKEIENNAIRGEKKQIKKVVLDIIENFVAKINILIELKNGNTKEAFEFAKIAYGDIDENLCEEAEAWYKKRIEFLREKKRKGITKSSLEKSLIEMRIDAHGIKKYFTEALVQCNFINSGLEVVINPDVSSTDVRFNDSRYKHPVILIPSSKKIDGMRLLELIAHEICGHVLLNYYNASSGYRGLTLSKNWEVFQEGIAIRNEVKIKQQALGDSYCDLKIKANPYFILAMKKIKEGAIASEVYDYIYELRKMIFIEMEYSEPASSKMATTSAKMFFGRVARGMLPYYFPKDKAYFEGEFLVLRMEKAIASNKHRTKLKSYLDSNAKFSNLAVALKLFADEKVLEIGEKMTKYILTRK